MNQQSGRSLIEVIGILAISAMMVTGAVTMYSMIRNRQIRTIAVSELEQIAKNTRLLMAPRGDYTGVSVDYLVKAGALSNTKSPLGGDTWSVTADNDGGAFSINLTGLSQGECDFLVASKTDWASRMRVNGYEISIDDYCFSSGDNQVSFIVE
ncbi:MAG: hypothetical protein K2L95_03390 [Alphaproteobacteria bacterium]|nr:hypothetical protein [Alphaproteobacteria bacterium]MDE6571230.1 hypothetical protein [Alphaproteobacteria bacterium]